MSSHAPGSPQPLKSTDARFVEVEFPRQLRPRLVIEFSGAAFFLRMLLLSVRSYISLKWSPHGLQ
jgi:hypothetical protein